MISEILLVKSVAAAATNPQIGVVHIYLQIIRAHSRQVHFYDPAVSRAVNVRRRIPQTPGWPHLSARGRKRKVTVAISHVQRIRGKRKRFKGRNTSLSKKPTYDHASQRLVTVTLASDPLCSKGRIDRTSNGVPSM